MYRMLYTLFENARNSLHLAIEFYGYPEYFEHFMVATKEEECNIKIALIFLENALELLLKAILASDNPSSIFIKIDADSLVPIQRLIKSQSDFPFDENSICPEDLRTISYGQTIDLYFAKYGKNNKVKAILTRLGKLRNAITHFGIHTPDEFDDVSNCMLLGFGVIIHYLYPHLVKIDEYYGKYNDILDLVESFFFIPNDRSRLAQQKEQQLRAILSSAITSNEFQQFAKMSDYQIFAQYSDKWLDGKDDINFLYVERNNEYVGELCTKYVLLENVTVIYETEGTDILMVFFHDTDELEYFKPNEFHVFSEETDDCDENYESYYFTWDIEAYSKKGSRRKLSEETMVHFLKKVIVDLANL